MSASEVCAEALAPFIERDWRSVRAHDLDWSVWDTIVHGNDDLYFYAAQMLLADEAITSASNSPLMTTPLPNACWQRLPCRPVY
jgi:hypothetical protein